MHDIKLKDRTGTAQIYQNIGKVIFDTPDNTSVTYYALGEQGLAQLDAATWTVEYETTPDKAQDIYYASEYAVPAPSGTDINKTAIYSLDNPSTNGKFAETIEIFDNDVLVSTHTAPAAGNYVDIENEDIFNSSGTNKTIAAVISGTGMMSNEDDMTGVSYCPITYSSELAQGAHEESTPPGGQLPWIEAKGTSSPLTIESDASYLVADLPIRDNQEGSFTGKKWYNRFYYNGNFKLNNQTVSGFTFYPCYYYRLMKLPISSNTFIYAAGRYKRGLLYKQGSISGTANFSFECDNLMPLEPPTLSGTTIKFPKFASALKLSIDGGSELTENGVTEYYDQNNYPVYFGNKQDKRFSICNDDNSGGISGDYTDPWDMYDVSGGIPHSVYGAYAVTSSSAAEGANRVVNNYKIIKYGLRNTTSKTIKVRIRRWLWDAFSSTDAVYFSPLDSTNSAYGDNSTTPTSYSFTYTGASSSLNSYTMTYTVPPGDHWFYVKTIIKTTRTSSTTGGDSSDAYGEFVFAFVLDVANNDGVDLREYIQDYDQHTITAYSTGDSHFHNSETVTFYPAPFTISILQNNWFNNDIHENRIMITLQNIFAATVNSVDIYSGNSGDIANMTYLTTLQPPSTGTDLKFFPADYVDSTTYSDKYIGAVANLDGGGTISTSYDPMLVTYYLGTPPNANTAVLGIGNLFQSGYVSGPVMTKTDDLAGTTWLAFNTVSSNTDHEESRRNTNFFFPFNSIKDVTDSFGNVFIQFPDMWFRVETTTIDNVSYVSSVAVAKDQGSTGNWYHVDGFCVAKYHPQYASPYYSKASLVRSSTSTYSMASYRTAISTFGSNYTLLDLYHQTVLRFLYWIWSCQYNPGNSAAGTSGKSLSSLPNTGTTLNKIYRFGDLDSSPYANATFGIEDFFGMLSTKLEGVVVYPSSGNIYATADKTYFNDSTTGKSLLSYKMPTSSGMVRAYGWDNAHPFLSLPAGVYTTYGESYNYGYRFLRSTSTALNHVSEGNYWNQNYAYDRGFTTYFSTTGTTSRTATPRLMYHGLLDNT